MTISTHPARRGARSPSWRVALAVGLLLVLGSACSDSEPEPAAPAPAGTPVAKAPTLPKVPAGELANPDSLKRGERSVPESFPDDLPLYPDSRPSQWMAGEGAGTLVVFDADGDPQAVYDFFAEKLPGAGWQLQSQSATPTHWMLVAGKGGRTARISIASAPGGGSQFGVATLGAE